MRRMQQFADGTRLAELLALVAVAEELSFTRAGVRLGRDATVLSRRIRALEARLGVRLLERTTRAVAPTEAGSAYLERARLILEAMDDADDAASELNGGEPRGHPRLALPGAFGRLWVAPALLDFLVAHPRVTIEAEFSNRYVDLVAESFDLAVRVGALKDDGLIARRIGHRRRLLCASPDYLCTTGRAARPAAERLPRVRHRRAPELDIARPGGAKRCRYRSRPALHHGTWRLLQRAAVRGLGILLSSEWAIGSELRSGHLVRVLPDWTVPDDGGIYLITPSSSHHASKTRAFADFLAARFRNPPWLAQA